MPRGAQCLEDLEAPAAVQVEVLCIFRVHGQQLALRGALREQWAGEEGAKAGEGLWEVAVVHKKVVGCGLCRGGSIGAPAVVLKKLLVGGLYGVVLRAEKEHVLQEVGEPRELKGVR